MPGTISEELSMGSSMPCRMACTISWSGMRMPIVVSFLCRGLRGTSLVAGSTKV